MRGGCPLSWVSRSAWEYMAGKALRRARQSLAAVRTQAEPGYERKWVYAVCFILLLGAPTQACNVPVFRYALEHWPADPYEFIVFHRGPLDPADQAVVDVLKKYEDDAAAGANLHFHRVDLSQPH